jgi:hypothetical protein
MNTRRKATFWRAALILEPLAANVVLDLPPHHFAPQPKK